MNTVFNNEKISTYKRIESLGMSERQCSRALAELAAADTLVGALFAAAKRLHLR